jgi:ethylbenzene hydroxylase subunit beta/complex iron-sulfur molybdoenzyme family reductase subunit beta
MSKRQLAMVMDLNKCIGCQTCTIACKTLWTRDEGMEYMHWNTVNTQPGQGTPRNWEDMGGGFKDGAAQAGHLPTKGEFGDAWKFNHKEVFYDNVDKTHLQIQGEKPEWGPNWDEDQGAGAYPNSYFFYLPRICNHCTNPACAAACPRKAIEKREEDGIVVVNEDRCRGYRFCMEACPYKKIYFNHEKGVSQKCIFCFPRIDQGVANACARQCPGRVRFVGYMDDEESAIYKLVTKWKAAVPLHPEYGTQPNVFYVPPTGPLAFGEDGDFDDGKPRIPDEYIRSLFGQAGLDAMAVVAKEMENVRNGGKSELMDTLIAYKHSDMFGGFDRDPATIKWVEA